MTFRRFIFCFLSVLLVAGCTDTGSSTEPSTPKDVAPPKPVAELAAELRKQDEELSRLRGELIGVWRTEFSTFIKTQGRFQRPLTQLYEKIGYRPFFALDETLDEKSFLALTTFLQGIGEHGIDPESYTLETLETLAKGYREVSAELNDTTETLDQRSQADPTEGQLVQLLREGLPEQLEEALQNRKLSDDQLGSVSAIVDIETQRIQAERDRRGQLARLDALMLRNTMQVLLDFRLVKRAHPFQSLEHLNRAPDYYADKLVRMMFPSELPTVADAEDSSGADATGTPEKKEKAKPLPPLPHLSRDLDPQADLAGFLAAQEPHIPLYGAMKKALIDYRVLAERAKEDPPPKLPSRRSSLKVGSRGPLVKKLKKRLLFEGYYNPTEKEWKKTVCSDDDDACEETRTLALHDRYDAILEHAVREYQTTHQLDGDGKLTIGTISSLNRSFAHRVKQLELGLLRYRESQINEDRPDVYLRVNIPEFRVALWADKSMVRSHSVVVGNNKLVTNVRKKVVGYLNRTTMFKAAVQSVVVNPYWRVPSRIKKTELDLELIDTPDFYERNRYEIRSSASGAESVRQMPGDDNALGRVKINFPNPYAIYMHDTPSKGTFKKTIRAQSHGCMRLKDPLDLAQFLLSRDESISEARFQTILEEKKEKTLSLKTPIPIYVEYNVTSVDEAGRPMFLSDIYRYDQGYFRGELPVVEKFQLAPYKQGKKIPFEEIVQVRPP